MDCAVAIPEPYTARPLTVEDAERVYAVITAAELHDLGEALIDLEDIVADWQRPSFDLRRDSVAVLGEDGELAAVAEVYRGERAETYVHPAHRGRGIGSALMRWSWCVARAAGAPRVGQTVPDVAAGAVELLRANGYRSAHTSWVLELPVDAEIVESRLPHGVVLRPFEVGRDEPAAYQVPLGAGRGDRLGRPGGGGRAGPPSTTVRASYASRPITLPWTPCCSTREAVEDFAAAIRRVDHQRQAT